MALLVLCWIIFITPLTSVFTGWLLGGAFFVGTYLACAFDAALQARQIGSVVLKRYNHLATYAGVAALQMILSGTYVEFHNHILNVRLFSVPSTSNLPNLRRGDTIAAGGGLFGKFSSGRGEYLIYTLPGGETDYVKRVIGLPGDSLQIKEGRLYINDAVVFRERLEDYPIPSVGGQNMEVPQYLEVLPNGRAYRILEVAGDTGVLNNTAKISVPEGHFFTLGDNRNNSLDSRHTSHGLVPVEFAYRKPLYIVWSDDRSRIGLRLDQPEH